MRINQIKYVNWAKSIFLSRKYHSHKTLKETLFKLETEFPDIAEVQNLKHTKIILFSFHPGFPDRDQCAGKRIASFADHRRSEEAKTSSETTGCTNHQDKT